MTEVDRSARFPDPREPVAQRFRRQGKGEKKEERAGRRLASETPA
jgi:hypothetical protein